jgi:drug/metabolite transporter (DMT)-like permease
MTGPAALTAKTAQGVFASVISSFGFATMDASTKGLLATMSPSIALVLRTALLLGGTVAWVLLMRRTGLFATRAVRGTVLRSLAFGFTSLLIVVSMKYLSLAETMAIYFLNPVLAVPLATVLLREPAGRWAVPAALLGFCGVLFVIQPTVDGIKWAYLIPLAAACSGAFHDVMSRRLRSHTAPLTLMIYGLLAALAWGAATADWSRVAVPGLREWALLVLAAGAGFIANFFVIVSFQLVPARLSAPLRYLILAWAALIGYLVWNQLPNFWAWFGITLILAAGFLAIASTLQPRRVAVAAEGV